MWIALLFVIKSTTIKMYKCTDSQIADIIIILKKLCMLKVIIILSIILTANGLKLILYLRIIMDIGRSLICRWYISPYKGKG